MPSSAASAGNIRISTCPPEEASVNALEGYPDDRAAQSMIFDCATRTAPTLEPQLRNSSLLIPCLLGPVRTGAASLGSLEGPRALARAALPVTKVRRETPSRLSLGGRS